MVEVNRSILERKLTTISSAPRSNSSFSPLLGQYTGKGQLMFWQDGYMPIWDSVDVAGEDEFTFSVDPSILHTIVSGFKSDVVDLKVNEKGSIIIQSGRSKVTVPFIDGPFDEIPEMPIVKTSCTVGRDFLYAVAKSKDFVSKTSENMSLTYTYIGNRDGKFFITASGAIYQYAATVPFSGDILPELIVPADYASLALRLFPTEDVQMGVTDKQHLVMSADSTLISTRTWNEKYPSGMYQAIDMEGEVIFTANKRKILESLRLASQTTKENMIGLSGIQDELDLYIPNATMEADLIVEDVKIVNEFPRTYFSLPFLIKCINTFDEDTINVEILSQGNGAFRIGTGNEEVTVLQPIQYDAP